MACSGGRAGGGEFGGQGAMNSGCQMLRPRGEQRPCPPPAAAALHHDRRLTAPRAGCRRVGEAGGDALRKRGRWPGIRLRRRPESVLPPVQCAVAPSRPAGRERGPARQASPAGLGAPAGSARKQQEAPAQARGRCGGCKPSAPRPEPRPAGCASRPCDCRRQRKPLDIAHFSSILRNNAQYRAEASRLCRPAGLRQAIKRRRAAVAHRRHHNTAEFPCEPR